MNHSSLRHRGFTLVEIMIVVLVVAILSALAGFAVIRIRNKVARLMVEQTLRQVYQAKETYFLNHPELLNSVPVVARTLAEEGLLRPSVVEALGSQISLEVKAGWHYTPSFYRDKAVSAAKGEMQRQAIGNVPRMFIVDRINYPASDR